MRLKLTSMHHATAPTNASSYGYYNDNDSKILQQYTLTVINTIGNHVDADVVLIS